VVDFIDRAADADPGTRTASGEGSRGLATIRDVLEIWAWDRGWPVAAGLGRMRIVSRTPNEPEDRMDFEDRLAATGCALKPSEFRRVVLDTFGEICEPDDLEDVVNDPELGFTFATVVRSKQGCEDVPGAFIVATVGRLLGGDTDALTPTELSEVCAYFERCRARANAELEKAVERGVKIHGKAFLDRLPEDINVVVDDDGKAHLEDAGNSPLDTRLN
jgi:hypothetical protein